MQVANHRATRPLEFALSTLALVAVAVRRMLKTRVTLGNISRALLNLIKRSIFPMFKDSFPVFTLLTHIYSLVHQLRLLLVLTVPLPYLFGDCLDMNFQLGRVYLQNV